MPADEEPLLTSTEAGAILGRSAKTVLRMADAGLLPVAHRVSGANGTMRLFRRADIEAAAMVVQRDRKATA